MGFETREKDRERWSSDVWWKTVPQTSRRNRNTLSPIVDSRVRWTTRDTDDAERNRSVVTWSNISIFTRARIVDFLWIAISWQSPRWYRDIITKATSADDRHQTRDIGKPCNALHSHNVRSHIPARLKHRDNGVCDVRKRTAWGELSDDASRAVTAVLNSRSHGILVTGIEMMQWPTGYVAADTRHHCSRSGMPVTTPVRPWCSRLL